MLTVFICHMQGQGGNQTRVSAEIAELESFYEMHIVAHWKSLRHEKLAKDYVIILIMHLYLPLHTGFSEPVWYTHP